MNKQELQRRSDELNNLRVTCECGHVMYPSKHYIICSWCGKKVYPKRESFKKQLLKEISQRKSND